MKRSINILFIYESDKITQVLVKHIQAADFVVNAKRVENALTYEYELDNTQWDLILSDYSSSSFESGTALKLLKYKKMNIPFILVSGLVDEAQLLEAFDAGAQDYIPQDNLTRLVPAIKRELNVMYTRNEKAKLENDLRASAEKFQSIYNSAPLAFIIWNNDGVITAWNEMAELIFGYNEEEAVGKSFLDLIVSREAEAGYEKVIANLKKDIIQNNILLSNITRDGKKIWCEWNNSVLYDQVENINAFFSTATDVTEKINAKKELNASKERFDVFMNHIPAGVFIKDSRGKYEYVNKFNEERIGIKNWKNKTAHDFFEKHIADEFTNHDSRVLNNGPTNLITRVKDVSNNELFFSTWYFPITRPDGSKLVGGISIDITHEVHIKNELETSEEKYRSIFENSALGIFRSTPDGEMLLVNEAFAKILGYSEPEELLSIHNNFGDIYRQKNRRDELVDLLAKQGFVNNFEAEFIKKDGSSAWISITATADLDLAGNVCYDGTIQDITQRKLAEEKLKESEQRHRDIFTYAPVGIYQSTNEGVFIIANSKLAEILGYDSVDELMLKNLETDIYCDAQQRKELIARYEPLGSTTPVEIPWKKKDGTKIWISLNAHALKDRDGKTFLFQGFVHDITARKQAEEALRLSQERYRGVVEDNPVLICSFLTGGKITFINRTYCKYFAKSPDELIGSSFLSLIPEREREMVLSNISGLTVKSPVMSNEHQVIAPGGGTRWQRWINRALFDDNGNIVSYQSIGEDITVRKNTEQALKESEERFRHIFENAQVGIYRTRVSDGKLIMANQRMAELLGYNSIEDAINDYVTTEHYVDKNARKKLLKMLKEKGRFDNYEAAISTVNQEVRWFQYSGKVYEKEGYIEGVAADITERKEFELELEKRNEFIQATLDNLPIGVALNEIDSGTASYTNQKFEEIYGWPAEEMKDILDFFQKVYPDKKYREELASRVMSDIQSGDHSRMHWEDCIITHKDGSKHIVNAQNIPLFEQNTMVSTVMDVTPQKEAELLLRESEHKYRSLVENSPFAILILQNKKIVFVNIAAERISGYTVNEILGFTEKKIDKILYQDDRELVWGELNRHLKQNLESSELEFRIKTKNNQTLWLGATITTVQFRQEAAVQAIIYDINEQKQAAQLIEKERNKAENYLETTAVMMLALNTKGEVTMINSAGAEILGYPKKDIIGKNWFDTFLVMENKKNVKKIFNEMMAGLNHIHHYEINTVKCRLNKVKTIGWHNSVLKDEHGKIIGTLSSGEDITEKLKLQKDLESSHEELKKLTEYLQNVREDERTKLARELHDDLGQSLTALRLDLSQILRRIQPDEEQLSKKVESAISLSGETLKTVQKITSDLRPGMIDDLGLIPAIRWYVDEFKERSGIKVKLNFDVEESDINEEYKISIYRIIQEALTNVIRHAHATRVAIRFNKKDDKLMLRIHDNGVGIKEKQINKPKSFGMIGMKERIVLTGGQFEVEGEKNKGTTIKITIPLR